MDPPHTPTNETKVETKKEAPSIETQDFISIGSNQALWSFYPVLSRYVQVKSSVPIDDQILLTSTKTLALILLFFFDLDSKPKTTTTTTTTTTTMKREESVQNNEETKDKSEKNEESKGLITDWDKFKAGATISLAAAGRASTNVASAKFTFAYNLVVVMSLSPILVTFADSILLKAKLPPTIWPTVILSAIGCSLIGIAQSPLMSSSEQQQQQQNEGPSMTSHIIGCSLQMLSTCFLTLYTLSVKFYAPIMTPNEVAKVSLLAPLFLPLIYTLLAYPSKWLVYVDLPWKSYVAIVGIAVLTFFLAATLQVSIIQKVGPGLYASLTGVRVVFVVLLSSIVLGEPIQNWLEWVGLILTISTMTWYVLQNVFPSTTMIGSVLRGTFGGKNGEEAQALIFEEDD